MAVHDSLNRLTPRQRECLGLAVNFWTLREIGTRLKIEPATVSRHISKALNTLGLLHPYEAASLFEGSLDDLAKGWVFLSYAKREAHLADRLRAALAAVNYVTVDRRFTHQTDPTDKIISGFSRMQRPHKVFVPLLTPDYLSSYNNIQELLAAISPACAPALSLKPLMIRDVDIKAARLAVRCSDMTKLNGEELIYAAVRVITAETSGIEPLDIPLPTPMAWTKTKNIAVIKASRFDNDAITEAVFEEQVRAVQRLSDRLYEFANAPTFNGSRFYAEQLEIYREELPSASGDGNIYITDASARAISNLFEIESTFLPARFCAQLRAFLENHIALRPFFPELKEFYDSIRTGALSSPLPTDAIKDVRGVIAQYSPSLFDPSVGIIIDKEARSSPPLPPSSGPEGVTDTLRVIAPPIDPIGRLAAIKTRDGLVSRRLNGLWRLFLKGRDLTANVEAWNKAYHALEPVVRPFIEHLRRLTGM